MNRRTFNKNKSRTRPDSVMSRMEAVYVECYDSLRSVIGRYLKRPEDVEDIAQETFVRVSEIQHRTRILNLRAYFFTTARNLSLKHLSLHTNKITDHIADLGLSEIYDERASLEDTIEAKEQFSVFLEAVRALPPQCRRVLLLKKVYGLPHAEIARRLSITVSTTNQHLARAIALCTQHMREKGYLGDAGHRDEKGQTDDNG